MSRHISAACHSVIINALAGATKVCDMSRVLAVAWDLPRACTPPKAAYVLAALGEPLIDVLKKVTETPLNYSCKLLLVCEHHEATNLLASFL